MALEIQWSKRADKKFDEIIEYTMQEWGERVTGSFVKKIYELLDILSEFPELGSIENEEKQIRGYAIIKQITIFYTIRMDKIILLDFFDNRQNPKKKKFKGIK